MRQQLTILFYFLTTTLFSQVVDQDYVNKWIVSCDSTVQIDAVKAYYVDGRLYSSYDLSMLNDRLRKIPIEKLKGIWYSKMKKDNYVPGSGTIYIMTIMKMEPNDAFDWLNSAKGLFVDKYFSSVQHIPTESKDPVLVIDGRHCYPATAKSTLEKVDPKDIYDISVNDFFPVPANMYGQNAKNGLVQIWTKKNRQ